ncbi:hypothetical protein TSUD_258200 [Trifolium subterraneum]|uniref:RST domain-containing protein n=1 Tax=Trifolium subterraneum TaxID=3900 RepID=A0A2Z6PAM6_TRISU|nr:hypothetical protein TSUD_258200 [Trifolium subterraneum]
MDPYRAQQMSNLLIKVKEQPRVRIKSRLPVVPYDRMFPFMTPAIGPDKTNELEALFDKYKRAEMPDHTFFSRMKGIVGKELISSATTKLLEQNRSQQVTGNKRPRTEIHSSKQLVPFNQLFPFLTPQIDSDKANEIQTLADQYERGELPKHTCVPLMKAILGEQMLRSAITEFEGQKSNQQGAVNEQPRTQTNSGEPVLPFDQLALFMIPQIDHDKAIELQTLVHKYQRREVPKYNFLPHMKRILGEQMLRSAGAKLEEHKRNMPATANEQPGTEIHSIKTTVPIDHLFRFLIPQIDVEKAIKIQTLAEQYQRGELPRYMVFLLMKCIVGEKVLSSAAAKLLEEKSKLEVTVIGQPEIQVNPSNLKVPLDQLFSSLIPQVDPDKVTELQTLAEKSKRGEIRSHNVVERMKGIVGEQILRSATAKLLAEKFNLHVTVHEQPRTQIKSSNWVVPSGPLFRLLMPHIDAGKAIEIQTLAYKYERGEIPKCEIRSLMEGIMGEQIFRSAVAKAREQVGRVDMVYVKNMFADEFSIRQLNILISRLC